MKVIFKPRFAPYFAPVFAPKLWFAPKKTAQIGNAHKENIMGLLKSFQQQAKQGMCVLSGLGLGAGLMYVFDPERGRRRRAMARDSWRNSAAC